MHKDGETKRETEKRGRENRQTERESQESAGGGGVAAKIVNMNIIRSEISKMEMSWVQLNIHIM